MRLRPRQARAEASDPQRDVSICILRRGDMHIVAQPSEVYVEYMRVFPPPEFFTAASAQTGRDGGLYFSDTSE